MNLKELKDYNYNYFEMYSDGYIDSLYRQIDFWDIFKGIFKNIYSGVGYIMLFFKNVRSTKIDKNKIIFLAFSINSYNALSSIYNILQRRSIMLSRKIRHDDQVKLIPSFIPLFLSYLYFPKFLFMYFQASSRERKLFKIHLDKILWSLGYEFFCHWYLRRLKPTAVVFANDHIAYSRIFISVAEKSGIKTFFVQHSSAFDNVPKIISSFALLEGNHAREKYLAAGSDDRRIRLIGMPKFDGYAAYQNKNHNMKRLGVCTNRSMDSGDVKAIIALTRETLPEVAVVLRPHPVMESKAKYRHIIEQYCIEFSNSRNSTAFDFLKNIDVVLSGNSSILIEAAMSNVFPIYYFSAKTTFYYQHDRYDKYDYVKNGVAYPIYDMQTLKNLLLKLAVSKPNIRQKAKYYCDTIDTVNEGRSASLAAAFIEEKL